MKFAEFKLEKWLLHSNEIDLGGGGVLKLKLRDVVESVDTDQLLNYGATNGSEELRDRIAGWYPGVTKDDVLVTTATSEANLLFHLHILEPGDEYVGIYPLYEQTTGLAESLKCTVKPVFLRGSDGWKLDLDSLESVVTSETKVIFLDNPNNPTGTCISEKQMSDICGIADTVGAYVACDNALRGSESDGVPVATPFPRYDKGVITGSLSKLGITGLRIGWLIGNSDVIDACWKLKDYTTLSHSGIGEGLATIALQPANRERYAERNRKISDLNRNLVSEWVSMNPELGSWASPAGGFTGFVRYNNRIELDSEELCTRFLEEERVLLSPGLYFGLDGHYRINIGCNHEDLSEGLNRLKRFMERLL